MKRGVIIIIIGILLLVATAVAYFFIISRDGGESQAGPIIPEIAPATAPEPTATPQKTVGVIVAVQEIPRGGVIEPDANGLLPVTLQEWPVDALPPGAIVGVSPEQVDMLGLPDYVVVGGDDADQNKDNVPDVFEYVIGRRLRTNSVRFAPVLDTQLSETGRIDLSGTGSDAALAAPPGRVVIAYPLPDIDLDPTSAVAYALRPGDHVDLILSLALVDLDEEFHTKLPNRTQLLDFPEEAEGEQGQLTIREFTTGRIEQGPLGLTFNIIPGEEEQRVRLVTQLTVQDAIVMRVGRYPTLEEEILGIDPQAPPTPTPTPVEQPEGEEGQPVAPAVPEPQMPEVIVLAVTPQEALVINFAWKLNASVNFALRAVGDQALFQTNPVTLQYLMETYNIAVPPKLQYGVEPPVGSIEGFVGQGVQGPTDGE